MTFDSRNQAGTDKHGWFIDDWREIAGTSAVSNELQQLINTTVVTGVFSPIQRRSLADQCEYERGGYPK